MNLHHIDFAQRYGKRILGMSKGELIFDGTAKDLNAETCPVYTEMRRKRFWKSCRLPNQTE